MSLRSILIFASVALGGCVRATTVPMGDPFPTRVGAPVSECEREGFLAVRPARTFSQGHEGYSSYEPWSGYMVVHSRTVSETTDGAAIFRQGEHEPEELPEVLPELAEPALEQRHAERIEPIEDKRDTVTALASTLIPIGAAATAAGLALMLTSSGEEGELDEPRLYAGGGVAIGGALTMGAGGIAILLTRPSAEEQAFANTRQFLLVPGEDDLAAAQRGVDTYNERVRQRCGGAPGRQARVNAGP